MSQQQPPEQMVRTYRPKYMVFWWRRAETVMRRDAAKLARDGWRITSQSAGQTGFTKQPTFTVVYQR